MAAFHLIIYGRFCVITEEAEGEWTDPDPLELVAEWSF